MRHLIVFVFFVICCCPVFGQNRHDNNWVFPNLHLGGSVFNFDGDTLNLLTLDTTVGRAREALACMSDKSGNLLFYTNNCTVFDRNHAVMEAGKGMNPGQIQTYWCKVNPYANPNDNSVIILPQPSNEALYQVLHWDYEAFNIGQPGGSQFAPLHLYHTVVDMSQNNGLGRVVSMNNLLIEDTLTSCALQAVRHANGRDWWVLVPEFSGNCYYKILLGPTGPQVMDKQCIGSNWGKYASGSAHFTNNGKYIRCDTQYGLNIFDFDRCTGELSNDVHVPIGPLGVYPINGMTLSPNDRFAYYNTSSKIFQYDLEAPDIAASKTLVATYDGFQSQGNSTEFYKSQLAPDGKIYINSFGPVWFIHVIEYPDSLGVACEVKQHTIELPNSHFAAMPNYPNYRLGALQGSPCDTIMVGTLVPSPATAPTRLYPNPTSGDIHIERKGGPGIVQAEILDLTGRVVFADIQRGHIVTLHKHHFHLRPGFYIVRVTDAQGRAETYKVVLE